MSFDLDHEQIISESQSTQSPIGDDHSSIGDPVSFDLDHEQISSEEIGQLIPSANKNTTSGDATNTSGIRSFFKVVPTPLVVVALTFEEILSERLDKEREAPVP